MSLPSRERGLKLCIATAESTEEASLPSRERGLKPGIDLGSVKCCVVAPFAGAWIETANQFSRIPDHMLVAPFVGAWIETCTGWLLHKGRYVAPFVGAWIETLLMLPCIRSLTVAPFVGAWIETLLSANKYTHGYGRSLRGSVD